MAGIKRRKHILGLTGRGQLAGRFTRNIDYNSDDYGDGITRRNFDPSLGETGEEMLQRLQRLQESPEGELWKKTQIRVWMFAIVYCTGWQYVSISGSDGVSIDVPEIWPAYTCPDGTSPGGAGFVEYIITIAQDGNIIIDSGYGAALNTYTGYYTAYGRYRFTNAFVDI
jgi:hypothetical protein